MTWLICSAVSSEQVGLKAFVSKGSEDLGLTHGLIAGQKVLLAPLGIGSVEAAISLTSIVDSGDFEKIYFVGTAGILPGHNLEIGQSVEVSWVQPSQSPGERLVGALFDNLQCDLRPDNEGVHVWCSQGVSESRELAEHASKFAAHVENLELWGVARVAKRFDLPFGAVLGLSNFVGEDAGKQWEENKELAAMAACQRMSEIIKASL